jgi:hypothetical protein
MYSGVPHTRPAWVSRGSLSPAAMILAMPKSSTLTKSGLSRRGSTITFSGLRSRWITPWACASARAESTCAPMRTMRGSGNGKSSATTRPRSRPARYSMAMNSVPSSLSPKSSTAIEFWWLRRDAARASRWKRWTI